jgi:DUF4097 and DUF4098 domain-containing protein YvlB
MHRYSAGIVITATLVAAACLGSVPHWATGSFDRVLDVSGPIRVEVETGSGAIDVRSADADRVTVKADVTVHGSFFDKRPSEDLVRELEKNPPVDRAGEVVRIGHIADRLARERVSIAYEIVVPCRARLQTTTGSGHLRIEGVGGPLDVRTGSGAIDITGARADVHAETGSGAVRLADARDGRFDLETGSGAIDATDVTGAVRVHAGSGRISVTGAPVERWDLETGSGVVYARVATEAGFDIAAHTGSGGIQVARTLAASEQSHGALRGRVGAGGPHLDLTTGSGEIRVE